MLGYLDNAMSSVL